MGDQSGRGFMPFLTAKRYRSDTGREIRARKTVTGADGFEDILKDFMPGRSGPLTQ